LVFIITPILAQVQQTAPIILDGRSIFEVNQSGQFSAQQRADEANRILKTIVNSAEKNVKVEIETNRELPIIVVDGGHFLSVTSNDTPKGRSVTEQAVIWKELLQTGIENALYERTPSYLIRAGLISLAVLILAFLINHKLTHFWHRWVEPWLNSQSDQLTNIVTGQPPTQIPTQPQPSNQMAFKAILMLIKGGIWFIALIYISRIFPQTRQLSYDFIEILANSLVTNIFSLGDNQYSFLDIVVLIVMLIALFVLSKAISQVLRSRVLSLTGLSRAAQDTIALIANYTIGFIGIIIILQVWGLDISSLTVFAGVLGVGIGLGIQGIAKEFISGLVLIFERPIQVGDLVEVNGLMGTVERISVRSTEIRTMDQVSIILPNSRFLESEVINWNHSGPVSRLKLPVGVAYGSDLSLVKNSLIDAAKEHHEVLSNPVPRVFFIGFGDSSLDFQLLVWIAKPYKQFQIRSDLYFIIDSIFRKREIEIPFPQRDLHLRSNQIEMSISPELIQSLNVLSQTLAQWSEQQQNQNQNDK
jgi:small-conductance mechanosensitive channel